LISPLLSGRVQKRLPAHFFITLWDACETVMILIGKDHQALIGASFKSSTHMLNQEIAVVTESPNPSIIKLEKPNISKDTYTFTLNMARITFLRF
jgi:hypothetical protein